VLEKFITSEILTRVWTAVVLRTRRRHGADDAEPIAEGVLLGHVEHASD